MSDSDSKDSDAGIRYKTESVRNKTKSDMSKKGCKHTYEDQTRNIYGKRYSRSPPHKKYSSKKEKRRRNSSSGSSSPSSNDRRKVSIKEHGQQYRSNYTKMESTALPKEIIGPGLSPHLLKTTTDYYKINNDEDAALISDKPSESQQEDSKRQKEDNLPRSQALPSIGPQLPPYIVSNKMESAMGLNVPPDLNKTEEQIQQEVPSSYGPQLPPHLVQRDNKLEDNLAPTSFIQSQENDSAKIIGPYLPPNLRKKLQEVEENNIDIADNLETELEDIYGPLPAGILNMSSSQKALEERALQLKIDQLGPKESNEQVRESWMTELPAAKAANFGLGPRQFRNRSGPDMSDRSSWTDVPSDKKKNTDKPLDLKAEAELQELRKRDKEQDTLTKKHKRKEGSLLKIHQEKLKQEKKNEGPSERRPFSRDIDMQVNRFDEAQKKAILKKAQLLDDRFSSGASKYL